ncbi:unnamed protein product [Acanthoscelides obtectus]|uniref:Uncharacterized protein n=1 Tax=Acanthoscelides obtectus TaxID=200917 RepID=A0A9P0VSE9_ACAOB|nr:unnamed protein product [Acanthoscelides obtectus]CAK1683025.1 hypothetical protein AOBTE_LOCUS34042 [Acanthoscelides obtectus]
MMESDSDQISDMVIRKKNDKEALHMEEAYRDKIYKNIGLCFEIKASWRYQKVRAVLSNMGVILKELFKCE